MKLIDMKVEDFLDVLSSNAPAPGGGSVSALSAANAASLVMMVSALTVNKKKFKALSDTEQAPYLEATRIAIDAKERFMAYVDEDTEAFNQVMAAFKLPKETEEEVNSRNMAIEKATVLSIKTPMKVAILTLDLLRQFQPLVTYSNRHAISDLGVAILLLYAAYHGSIMNVKINLSGLSEKSLVKEYKDVIIEMTNEVIELKDKWLEEINYLLD